MDIVGVVNLRARRGTEAVARKLRAELPTARVVASRSVDEVREFVAAASRPHLVVSAGGDGTALGLLNSLGDDLPALGVLPLGTGNAWAGATNAPAWQIAVEQLGRVVAGGLELPLSRFGLVSVDGQLAHYAGTGWDAEIIDDFHAQQDGLGLLPKSRRMGMLGYLHGVFTRTIPRGLRLPPVDVELTNTGSDALTLDDRGRVVPLIGGEHGKVLYRGPSSVCAAGTTTEWGFGFRAFPFARVRPDRFNMRICSGSAAWAALHMRSLWRGEHPHPKMHSWLLDGCRASFSRPVPFQAGGDRIGHKDVVEYKLAKHSVDLIDWRSIGRMV